MPSPSFLNTGAKFDTDTSDDVQAAIDLFDDIVLNQLDASEQWSAVGGGEYETPVQEPAGAARKFRVKLTRAEQDQLEVLVKDQNGQTVFDGEVHLVGSTEIKVFAGPWHFAIQFLYDDGGPTYELALGGMTDPRPLPLNSHHVFVAAKTTRDSNGDAVSNHALLDYWVMRDANIGSGHTGRVATPYAPSGTPDGRTSGGSNFHLPCEMVIQPTAASIFASTGKLMQFILASSAHPPGSVIEVPVSDDGGVGVFEVLGLANVGSGWTGVLAVRRSAP